MRRVGRPVSGMAKQLIAIRLSPRLLSQLRKMAAKQGEASAVDLVHVVYLVFLVPLMSVPVRPTRQTK